MDRTPQRVTRTSGDLVTLLDVCTAGRFRILLKMLTWNASERLLQAERATAAEMLRGGWARRNRGQEKGIRKRERDSRDLEVRGTQSVLWESVHRRHLLPNPNKHIMNV